MDEERRRVGSHTAIKGQTRATACPFCEDHNPNDKEKWMSQGSSRHVSLLEKAMQDGCPLCTLIYRGVNVLKPRAIENNAKLQILIRSDYICLAWTGGEANYSYQQPAYLKAKSYWPLYFYSQPTLPPPWPTLKAAPVFSAAFGDPAVFDRLKTWIHDCCQNHTHPICQRSIEQPLPTRVVDVGSSQHPALRLIEPISGTRGSYIALSHCWGRGRACITEKQTLSQRKHGINADQMPKTFRDAVHVAREINVRYIWIDSLCIIQDDPDDWQEESMKMCDVYQKAFLTISAASGMGDEDGFLNPRPVNFQGKQIEIQSDDGSSSCVVAQEKIKHFSRDDDNGAKPPIGDPLETRAWTLQEDLLSRRILSFGIAEVSWECAERFTCECKEIDEEQSQYDDSYRKLFSASMTRTDTYRRWMAICVQYSQRKLTKASDRLPALAGLAIRFKELLADDRYIAGLWLQDLLRGLLWVYDHHWSQIDRRQRTAKMESVWRRDRAPTWSWASIDGAISYAHLFRRSQGTREEGTAQWFTEVVDLESLKANWSGKITDGILHLRGPVITAVINWTDDRRVFLQVAQYLNEGESVQEWREGDELELMSDVPLDLIRRGDGSEVLVRSDCRPDMDWPERISVDCLVVGASDVDSAQFFVPQTGGFERKLHQVIYMIMLGPSQANTGAYERVGYLSVLSMEKEHMRWIPRVPIEDVFLS